MPAGLLLAVECEGTSSVKPVQRHTYKCQFPRSRKSAQPKCVDALIYATPIYHHTLSLRGFNISGKNTRLGWQELGSKRGWIPQPQADPGP